MTGWEMEMFFNRKPKKELSQVFLTCRGAEKLVNCSSTGPGDVVVEIGPGRGVITELLAKRVGDEGKVIGIEIDPNLCENLRRQFKNRPNVQIYQGDALKLLPKIIPKGPWKTASNPPFQIMGKKGEREGLIRLLLGLSNPPEEAVLVTRGDLAQRWTSGGLFRITYEPLFEISVFSPFSSSDFQLRTLVHPVVLRFKKRKEPLIEDYNGFVAFVRKVFGRSGRNITKKLEGIVGYRRLKKLGHECGFDPKNPPSALTSQQWIAIYKAYKYKER